MKREVEEMADIYQVGKVGTLNDRHEFGDLEKVLEALGTRLDEITGPFQIRRPEEDFSQGRSKENTIERVRDLLDKNDGGIRLVIRGSEPKERVIALRRTIKVDGPEVLQEAVRNIGVPYDFGSMNPAGPAGGKGAQLDCSGSSACATRSWTSTCHTGRRGSIMIRRSTSSAIPH
jgi:hypothetical protein